MTRLWPVLAATACAAPAPSLVPQVGSSELEAVPTRSELVLRCVPDDAEVVVDGVPQGTCADYDGRPHGLALGRSGAVVVKKPGFLPWEGWVSADGTRVVMDVRLHAKGKEGSTP